MNISKTVKNKSIGYSSVEIDKKFSHLCVSNKTTVLEAMKVIEQGKERLCFVVDSVRKLERVISDGDIRRALIGGKSLNDLVVDLHEQSPIVVRDTHPEKALDKLSKWVTIIPVVDTQNRIVGISRLVDLSSNYNIRQRSVAIVGLGYVGLTLAVVLADNGFSVVGFDRNKNLIEKLNNKEPTFYENGLENLLGAHIGSSFLPSSKLEELLADIYIITVGTPVNKNTKKPDVDYIKAAVKVIAAKLKLNDLVILRSTVPVGCTRTIVVPILEKISGLKAGNDFFVSYCPERTAEGRALKELRELPQIVGGLDQASRQISMRFFNAYTHTVIDVGSLEAAELCKLLDNTYRDAMFGYANQMAMFAEKFGLNLKELVKKVNVGYERNKIPLPSPGVGGPCLSKDPYILMDGFSKLGLESPITSAARQVNEAAPKSIFDRTEVLLNGIGKSLANDKIFIVGFAFKGDPMTSDLRDSTTIWFLDYLKIKGAKNIWGYDPIVPSKEISDLGVECSSLDEGFEDASVVFIMNNHRSYFDMNIYQLLEKMSKPAVFYDGWNLFPAQDIQNVPGIIYSAVGVG